MKTIKLLSAIVVTLIISSSCTVQNEPYYDNSISLEQLVSSYDLWYVDYNKTEGNGDVPFLSIAFTLSFIDGDLYANNNLVGLGSVGNGYGDQIGYYNTNGNILEIDHDIDGFVDLEVFQLARNEIALYDNYSDTTYHLFGYSKYDFDYDQVFYDNIEYFLQEYGAWAKTYISDQGEITSFDNENFLQFTPEFNNTFRSSEDPVGTDVDAIYWDYAGAYEVFDVAGYDNLKILTLDYDSYGTEEFELTVIDDGTIDLYNVNSGTTYTFEGRQNIIFKNATEKKQQRKRFKVARKTKTRSSKI